MRWVEKKRMVGVGELIVSLSLIERGEDELKEVGLIRATMRENSTKE